MIDPRVYNSAGGRIERHNKGEGSRSKTSGWWKNPIRIGLYIIEPEFIRSRYIYIRKNNLFNV